jgi:hypothetical protein
LWKKINFCFLRIDKTKFSFCFLFVIFTSRLVDGLDAFRILPPSDVRISLRRRSLSRRTRDTVVTPGLGNGSESFRIRCISTKAKINS